MSLFFRFCHSIDVKSFRLIAWICEISSLNSSWMSLDLWIRDMSENSSLTHTILKWLSVPRGALWRLLSFSISRRSGLYLAWIFWQKIYMGISKSPSEDIRNGLRYAEASLLRSPNLPGALSATASLEMMAGTFIIASHHFQRSSCG